MKASALEFRLRFFIHAVIYVLGFTAPWNYLLHLDNGIGPRQLIAAWLTHHLSLGFATASSAVTVIALLFAIGGAALRTWGTAYLSASVMKDGTMHGDSVVADGPYRYLRNPLYLGTWLHSVALAMLMPPSGAIFSLVVIGIVQVRLIGGEEAFLTERLGTAYLAYQAAVPRFFPSLRPRVASSGARPSWGSAFVAETYMWGVVISYAMVGWRYNAILVIQGVIISLGVSLVARAFLPKK